MISLWYRTPGVLRRESYLRLRLYLFYLFIYCYDYEKDIIESCYYFYPYFLCCGHLTVNDCPLYRLKQQFTRDLRTIDRWRNFNRRTFNVTGSDWWQCYGNMSSTLWGSGIILFVIVRYETYCRTMSKIC